jgi:hypothetical protein
MLLKAPKFLGTQLGKATQTKHVRNVNVVSTDLKKEVQTPKTIQAINIWCH